jgi:hypothetical protein
MRRTLATLTSSERSVRLAREYTECRFQLTQGGTPASPWQNGYAESFQSELRDELLEREDFESAVKAQALADLGKEEYNTERPHSSLEYPTPTEFAATCRRYVPFEKT